MKPNEAQGTYLPLDETLHSTSKEVISPFYLRNSFSYSGAVLWNNLPQNVRQAESLNNLKTLLKKHYRNK